MSWIGNESEDLVGPIQQFIFHPKRWVYLPFSFEFLTNFDGNFRRISSFFFSKSLISSLQCSSSCFLPKKIRGFSTPDTLHLGGFLKTHVGVTLVHTGLQLFEHYPQVLVKNGMYLPIGKDLTVTILHWAMTMGESVDRRNRTKRTYVDGRSHQGHKTLETFPEFSVHSNTF